MKLEKPNRSQLKAIPNRDELDICKKVNRLYVELVSLASPDKVSTLYKSQDRVLTAVANGNNDEAEE